MYRPNIRIPLLAFNYQNHGKRDLDDRQLDFRDLRPNRIFEELIIIIITLVVLVTEVAVK